MRASDEKSGRDYFIPGRLVETNLALSAVIIQPPPTFVKD
jgi:hypothetical protein